MKKSILGIVAASIFAFALASCSQAAVTDAISGLQNNDTETSTTSETNATEDNTTSTTNTDSDIELQKDTIKTEEEIKTLLGDKYVVTIESKYTDGYNAEGEINSPIRYMYKGKYSIVSGKDYEDNDVSVFLNNYSKDRIYVYESYNETTGKYEGFCNAGARISFSEKPYLIFTNSDEIEYTSKTTGSYLNRDCLVYTHEISTTDPIMDQHSITTTYIDDVTGAILYSSTECESIDHMGKEDTTYYNKNEYYVKEFKLSLTEAEEAQIDAEIAKIGIEIFSENIFASFGLENVELPEGWNVNSGSYTKDASGNYSFGIYLNGLDYSYDEGQAALSAYVESIYQSGAKYDNEGNLKEYDGILKDTATDYYRWIINFDGYAKANDELYYVYVSGYLTISSYKYIVVIQIYKA